MTKKDVISEKKIAGGLQKEKCRMIVKKKTLSFPKKMYETFWAHPKGYGSQGETEKHLT